MAKSKSEYTSPFDVAKRQTVYLDKDDPRVRGLKAGITAARLGAEMKVINDPSLSVGGEFSSLKFSSPTGAPKVAETVNVKSDGFIKPSSLENLSADWDYSDNSLIITFDIDLNDDQNKYVSGFQYKLYVTGEGIETPLLRSTIINKTDVSQTIKFTFSDNSYYLGFFRGSFSLLEVQAFDSYNNLGDIATLDTIPEFVVDLCIPEITVSSIPMGYSAELIDVCSKPYEFISIEEVVSDSGTAPTSGYQQVYLSNIKPATILTPTTDSRWVKARYTSKTGLYGEYSNAVKVTPTNPISADLTPPSEVTSVSGTWSGDNIVISYTLPTTDAGVRFKLALTAPNSSIGYFYFFPVIGTLNQTAIISKTDLFLQFGSHYSSYSGVLKSIDVSDNQSAGVGFAISQRPNPLVGIVPTFTTTALVNGYSVSYTLPAGAAYGEVYQKYSSWSGVTPVDSFSGAYLSGGASGTNTVTISNVVSNKGIAVSPISGYRVVGEGIPANTYITSVSGNEITTNNNFTSQVSGTVTAYALVYSGTSPANISSTIYENTYLLVRYYDDFDNSSSYSAEQIVAPLSPTTVDITGPGNVSEVGLSSTSGIDESGSLGFNGYIDLSWPAVTESTMRGYRIRFTTDTVDPVYSYVDYPIDQTNIPTGTLSYRLAGLAVGASYYIGIATYDQFNNLSTEFVEFDPIQISGTPAISDYISAGGFQFGVGVDPDDLSGISGIKRGLFFDDSNYWFLNNADSARIKIGGSANNYVLWDGAKFTIDGDITARGGSFSGNIALTTSGASIYSGDVITSPGNLTGDGFIFNKDGLLIRKGTNQVSLDTTNGAITANNGNIADWLISVSKIERLDPISTRYAGLSSTGQYKFWSGSIVAGGDTSQFAVDRDGKLYAKSVEISGGTLDIGAPSTDLSSGFHVLSSGTMYATGAVVNGAITATSGSIRGNFQVVEGSFYTGTSPTSTSVIINDKGLASIGSTNNTLTAILNTPISSGTVPIGDNPSVGTLPSAITFFTKAALIGGWVINDRSIRDRSEQFILDSTDKRITVTGVIDATTNYRVRFGTELTGSGSGTTNIFEAGQVISGVIQTPSFYITQNGILNAVGAVINGNITATTMNSTGNFSFANNVLSGTTTNIDFNLASGNNLRFLNMPSSDDDGFAGDPTLTIRSDSKIVKGRRFLYTSLISGNTQPSDPLYNGSTQTYQYFVAGEFRDVKPGDILFVQE